MTETKTIFIACLASLIPWGVVALVTNWYEPNLSIGHALLLATLQIVIGVVVGIGIPISEEVMIEKGYTRKEKLALWSIRKILGFFERIDHLWPH